MTTFGGTRAARAATSRQVKQKLVNMLFGKEFRKSGPDGHRQLDYSIYKYEDLKKAYLERLHVLHPDKQRNMSSSENARSSEEVKRQEFHQLQEVWTQYDEMAKSMMKVTGGDGEAANFTLFGVGCSFSDNDAEKALRNDITDQACRGWFSSGLLADQSQQDDKEQPPSLYSTTSSLMDDSLFVEAAEEPKERSDKSNGTTRRSSRRTLIPGMSDGFGRDGDAGIR
jgi:hypothetical protein